MDATDPTLPVKYQKLMSEFSKLKSQIILVNKALIEEQNNGKELREQVKEKDRLAKQLQQDADGREFRNQQLTRRVSVLQDELRKSSISEQDDECSTFSIFDAELSSKIKQIAELHQSLQKLTLENESLRDEIRELHLKHKDDEFMIKSQEEVIQGNRILMEQLSQNSEQASHQEILESDPYSMSRISSLTDAVEAADAKAALFGAECQRMKQRLLISNEQKESLRIELSDTSRQMQKLKDEFGTSVRNYESQLEAMSEHLATMNDKWSQQQIEMDALRQTTSQKKPAKFH